MKDAEFKKKRKLLEEIIQTLENGKISLSEGEKLFKQGKRVINELRSLLDSIGESEYRVINGK